MHMNRTQTDYSPHRYIPEKPIEKQQHYAEPKVVPSNSDAHVGKSHRT